MFTPGAGVPAELHRTPTVCEIGRDGHDQPERDESESELTAFIGRKGQHEEKKPPH
jgi:hypothetical protein